MSRLMNNKCPECMNASKRVHNKERWNPSIPRPWVSCCLNHTRLFLNLSFERKLQFCRAPAPASANSWNLYQTWNVCYLYHENKIQQLQLELYAGKWTTKSCSATLSSKRQSWGQKIREKVGNKVFTIVQWKHISRPVLIRNRTSSNWFLVLFSQPE